MVIILNFFKNWSISSTTRSDQERISSHSKPQLQSCSAKIVTSSSALYNETHPLLTYRKVTHATRMQN